MVVKQINFLSCKFFVVPNYPMHSFLVQIQLAVGIEANLVGASMIGITVEGLDVEVLAAAMGGITVAGLDAEVSAGDVAVDPEKSKSETAVNVKGDGEPREAIAFYPAELTATPNDIFYNKGAWKVWSNLFLIISVGGSYRAALWSGWKISAAVAIGTTLVLGTWQATWQMARLGIGNVPTWAMLLELTMQWSLFAGEKYFLGPFQLRSKLLATLLAPWFYVAFRGRRVFGMGTGVIFRLMGALTLFLGSYLAALRALLPTEDLQDIFYPVVALVYKIVLNPLMRFTWMYFPGRRDCSALWLTAGISTVAVSSEGFYYGGLALMLAIGQGSEWQVVRRGAISVATHAAFVILGRFNVIGTAVLFARRMAARQVGWRVPEIEEYGAQKDLVLRSSSMAAYFSWVITFLSFILYMLASLAAHNL
ncbi:unnamed protein product [Symbiodinium natans]|uniref:Uncharacterized protein n=1 Tax=Symbiodinium natans TaxID=878477 RepID=A0A812TQW6_9DINO|nr:unnamed protein product [Symbiodinium natans]